jgi:hypothetical protein
MSLAMPADAYRQWREMAANAKKIEKNPSIPLWQKAYRVPGSFQGLELDKLNTKDRKRVLNTLQKMNTILAPYQFESFDEYQFMDEKDAKALLLLSRGLMPGKT